MSKKDQILGMFNKIAHKYDQLNHIMSLGIDHLWRKYALKEIVRANEVQTILDAACGTGDFSIAIARRIHPESRIVGVDISEGMLAVMQEKVCKKGLEERISCQQGDCECLKFDDHTFDCVTIGFGIRNMEHREQALKEFRRVLKPGGKLVILELSTPTTPIIRWCYTFYFTRITPLIGGLISGNKKAYRYLPASVLHFPMPQEWMAIMTSCGYANIRHKALSLGICRMYVACI